MKRYTLTACILFTGIILLALAPLARVASDYQLYLRVIDHAPSERGYDWVTWKEVDGLITAVHVFNPGESGLRKGDLFYRLDYRQYFTLEDLQHTIERIPLGSTRTYSVLRGPDMEEVQVNVLFSRYPTFLYPITPGLWRFSVWGFVIGTFLHLIGFIIAAPLVRRSRTALFSLFLILVSFLWIGGNLARMLMVQLAPPIHVGSADDNIFQLFTFLGLTGWIGFPALLLHKVIIDSKSLQRWLLSFLYLPVVILGGLALVTILRGNVGPLTLDGLVVPILFYACCYVGGSAAFALYLHYCHGKAAVDLVSGWPRLGSAVMLLFSILFGLSLLGVVPVFGFVTDTAAGWVIVSAQLLSIVPVVLVSLATLRHGKIDRILRRTLAYLTTLGLIFFLFVGGMELAEPLITRLGISVNVAAGVYVIFLLVVFERLARRLRNYVTQFFATDRQQARKDLSRFQERIRSVLDLRTLAQETIDTVGGAFRIRSGHLFLHPSEPGGSWIDTPFHPEPPYMTERVVRMVWPHFRKDGTLWARRPELNESSLPHQSSQLLREHGIHMAVPILGNDAAQGLLVLGPKRERRAVYNLEDMVMLRALAGQLALAIERLHLFERERVLVRESAEAQLSALRAQINPHFLFNALNTIIALIEDASSEAEEAVEHLASIFRYTLHTGGREFVSLEEELALVGHYLSIEKARFGKRLKIQKKLDTQLYSTPIPAFTVQTLVENAIKHGLEKRREGGTLSIHCEQVAGGFVQITVTDTGVGIAALFGKGMIPVSDSPFFGFGLRNIATRLAYLYEQKNLLRMESDSECGTTAKLLIPVKKSAGTFFSETADLTVQ